MELSVIIVSYNVRHFLEQCLLSVRKASLGILCEVFVVDNNSADGSCSMVTSEFPEVKLIMNQQNCGFSAANNQALKLAEGKYILILNPDTIVQEDTFIRCISFMESHSDAGITGVKMIDGKGRYLPESKRGIPTPETALYKILGLPKIFPKSEKFNRYYLGHLDENGTAKADILSGAFMFIRREAFLRTGFFDEKFFMHGEDIDYCYRVLQQGYNNYYYPGTSIIHYKGESTKKENLNVFIALHKAMIIFVRKHFSKGKFRNYIVPVQLAILFRAGLSLFGKLLSKLFLPAIDGCITYFAYALIATIWGSYKFGGGYMFPEVFYNFMIPAYSLIILVSTAFFRGYKLPAKIINSVKGLLSAITLILMAYALLPESLRYSRAIILLGGVASLIAVPLIRLVISIFFPGVSDNPFLRSRKTIIVADSESYLNVIDLISDSENNGRIAGRVSLDKSDMKAEVLGSLDQLHEVIRINRIREVIFTTGKMSAASIIESMSLISDQNVTIRIASAGEKYLFGTRYINPENQILPLKRHSVWRKIGYWLNK